MELRTSLTPALVESGGNGAEAWTEILPGSRRRRPYWGDANDMLRDDADVRAWVEAGLAAHGRQRAPERDPAFDQATTLADEIDLRGWEPDVEGDREECLRRT